MATLKQKLRANGKYLFWGGTALVVIIGLACWFMSTKGLASVYASRKSAIESTVNTGNNRLKVSPHPNDTTIAAVGKSVNQVKGTVLGAWKEVYDVHKTNIYVWPATGLTKEFLAAVQKLTLDLVKNPTDKEKADDQEKLNIPLNLREQFPKYSREQFPKLVKAIDAQWFKETDAATGAGPVPGKAAEAPKKAAHEYKIEWQGQNKIQSRFDLLAETPTTLHILYVQEDLWVYKAFCDILAEMNARAKGRHDAVVWVIQALEIGQTGVEASPGGLGENRVTKGQVPAGTGGEKGAALESSPKGSTAPAATGEPSADDGLRSNRYVTLDGRPLSGADLQLPPSEDKKFLLQYRLMPFKLRLVMDERKIDDLLVALHNAVLPIEVRQVRMNPGAKAGDDKGEFKKFSPYATLVELRGVVYLANPPDMTLLKTDEPAAETPADAGAPKPEAKLPDAKPDDAGTAGGTPPADAPIDAKATETKPTETKPTETKPTETKPTDTK